jgi:NADH:ubiquinone oxidoreductase subunit 5 (subunit L)/multisubunit Na+/H+ antiporter MnhA subunit
LIRFGQQLVTFSTLRIFFGLSTLITASLSALAETDGKKVVALSTLSQLGLIYLSLSLGGAVICLFHLLIHAFAKANLFLIVGNFIHSRFSQQDSRQSSSGEQSASAYLIIVVRLLRLRGIVFFSGFFSKDLILILQYPLLNRVIRYGIILRIVSLTFSYCFKLILTLLRNRKSGPVKEKLMRKAVLLPRIILTTLRVLMG